MMSNSMDRWLRCCSALLLAAGVSACSSLEAGLPAGGLRDRPDVQEQYGALQDEGHAVRSVNLSRVDEKNLRQIVRFETQEEPGTIVIDTTQRFLYLVQGDGMALRYGIGVGKEGLEFTGSAIVGYKREWPRWTPTPDMIRRNPALYLPWQKGMDGGPTNPLGARALYLFKNGQDTLFRIHGTTEPWTIGTAASSGCIRMFNQDVIDLYGRVPRGAKVVVLGA